MEGETNKMIESNDTLYLLQNDLEYYTKSYISRLKKLRKYQQLLGNDTYTNEEFERIIENKRNEIKTNWINKKDVIT